MHRAMRGVASAVLVTAWLAFYAGAVYKGATKEEKEEEKGGEGGGAYFSGGARIGPSFPNAEAGESLDRSTEGTAVPLAHRQLATALRMSELPKAPHDSFDLSSHTPFCSNGTYNNNNNGNGNDASPGSASERELVEEECVRWEEQELDMLMMYMDLIAVGMQRSLAQQFYRQLRCLARRNVRPDALSIAWSVCFAYDFSEHVGTLLAHYVNQDFNLNPPVKPPSPSPQLDAMSLRAHARTRPRMRTRVLNDVYNSDGRRHHPHPRQTTNETTTSSPSSRFLFPYASTSVDRGLFLLLAFGDSSTFRLFSPTSSSSSSTSSTYEQQRQTSCCSSCADDNYFVNIEQNQCVLDPFGKHCCHKACKSLGRLRVGVSSSITYCCAQCTPTTCKT